MKNIIALILITSFLISSCQRSANVMVNSLSIGAIQSCSHISPYQGEKVVGVEGVVTHKFKDGFSMQSIVPDSQPCTSEAIFVTTGVYPSVYPGQLVRVDGIVQEYFPGTEEDHNLSRTELHDPSIVVIKEKVDMPQPTILGNGIQIVPLSRIKDDHYFDIQNNGLDYYESLEFMLVGIASGIVVGPKNSYNEFYVLPEEFIAKNNLSSQSVLLQLADDENPEKVMIDAASSFTKDVNAGDTFTNPIVGIMDYSFGNFKIWTIKDPVIQTKKITLPTIDTNFQSLRLATYNIENFSQFDEKTRIQKLACQISKDLHSPDIVLLHEVLDDSGIQDDQIVSSAQTLHKLIGAINYCGGPVYAYSDNPPENNRDGGIQGGNIRTALIYRKDSGIVLADPSMEGEELTLHGVTIKVAQNPLRLFNNEPVFSGTRKPTLWLFTWKEEQFLILGLHLVSQSGTSPLWGNIQPPDKPELEKRVAQMRLVNKYVDTILIQKPDTNLILLGDFNDYSWSDTLNLINSNLMTVLSDDINVNENFSYIHEGNGFQFDFAVVSNNLFERINNYSIFHGNTIINYNDQISDHDPIYFEILE